MDGRIGGPGVGDRTVEQARSEFPGQDAAYGPVNPFFRDATVADRLDQQRIASGAQVDVHARFQGQFGSLLPVGGNVVCRSQPVDAAQVGDDQAVEAPRIAQHAGQQRLAGRAGHSVDGIVGGHHAPGAGFDGTPERRQEAFAQFPFADGRRIPVVAAGGDAIGHEMLQRGGHALRRGALHHRRRQLTRQEGVFAKGFLHPRPARLTRQVDHRPQRHRGALRPQFRSDYPSDGLQQGRIPRGRQADACRENRRADGHVPVRRFFEQEQRNLVREPVRQTGRFNRAEPGLQCLLRPGIGPERRPECAAVLCPDEGVARRRPADTAVGSLLVHRPAQRAEQLSDLFLQRHRPQQRIGPSAGIPPRIRPRGTAPGGNGQEGQDCHKRSTGESEFHRTVVWTCEFTK